MMKSLIKRFGPRKTAFVAILGSVAGAAVIVGLLDLLIKRRIVPEDIIIGMVTASILASVAIIGLIRVVQQLTQMQGKLRSLANEDYLTNVASRRHLIRTALREWRRAQRYGHCLTVLMLDADDFKMVNDAHGHLAGDAALRHIARICRQSVRAHDLVGRYGGEEFVILLPETSAAEGLVVAERLRKQVDSTPVKYDGMPIRVTVSVGLAENTDSCTEFNDLLSCADLALQAAKRAGKNRTMGMPETAGGE